MTEHSETKQLKAVFQTFPLFLFFFFFFLYEENGGSTDLFKSGIKSSPSREALVVENEGN